MAQRHTIGLLLAVEESWPTVFGPCRRVGSIRWEGEEHELVSERVVNEPFDLRSRPAYSLCRRSPRLVDLPREWLKKVALMDDVYLLNNPFTFQAMKHAAYCALMRLGFTVPETWLIPHKLPPDDPRFAPLAERYYREFDLDEIAAQVGYALHEAIRRRRLGGRHPDRRPPSSTPPTTPRASG